MDKKFLKYQWKFIICSMIAYMFFYMTRKNLSMAQPVMLEEKVISTYALGIIMTVHGVLYGVSRFANGFFADRLNGRWFMAIGLALCALMNFCFGCTSLSLLFAAFWILNGWFQGMGFPPCAKMLSQWVPPEELATKQSVWNTSHSFGAVLALGLCSGLFALGFGWRWCFYVPAMLAALAAIFCFLTVKDNPTEEGLEPLKIGEKSSQSTITNAERRKLVFGNKVIWMVAIANFFVYVVRFGFLDWGPTFLKEFKGISVEKGGLMIIGFELAAVVGTIFTGWITDKLFAGRGTRTCVLCMLFTAIFSFGFWYLPEGASMWTATALLMGAGFFIYGPQSLMGIVASKQATKEAAAMANGFCGIMGYASTTVSGIGIAFIKESFGWGVTLCSIAGFALIGMLLFLFVWNASADGYKRDK